MIKGKLKLHLNTNATNKLVGIIAGRKKKTCKERNYLNYIPF